MPDPVWGADGSSPEPSAPRVRKAPLEPIPDWLRSTPDPDHEEPSERDPVGDLAIACGLLGIVIFGIVLAIVTAILAGWAGQRARDARRNFGQAYLGFGLAFVDGLVWIVIHYLTKTPIWIG